MKQREIHYFSPDGNYGDSEGLLIVDTSKWSHSMWVAIEEQVDDDRVALANHFDNGLHDFSVQITIHGFACRVCGLVEGLLVKR